MTAYELDLTQDIEIDNSLPGALPCPVDAGVGGCCFAPAVDPWNSVAEGSTPRDLGTIVVSDRSTDKTLLRLPFAPSGGGAGPSSGYSAGGARSATWTPGDELGLEVSGTELAVRSPLPIDATLPLQDGFLDAGGDLTLRWTPDPHVTTTRVEYIAYGPGGVIEADAASPKAKSPPAGYAICDVPDASGSVTIPEAHLGLTSTNGTWPSGEITFTRTLSAVTSMRGSRDTLELDAEQQLSVNFQSRKTCSTDADCGDRLGCRCSLCIARDRCTADADCGDGSYCTSIGANVTTDDGCLTGTCAALPATITCGASDCMPHIMHFDAKTTLAIAPCCISGTDACGLDVSPLIITNDKCQPFGQGQGAVDHTCPGCTASCAGGAIAACRRTDGHCGFALDDIGLGCVVDPLAP